MKGSLLDDVFKQDVCYYTPKRTLFIACPHQNRVDQCLATFDGLENGMNLATNHMNHNCFSKTIKCNCVQVYFE